MDPREEARIAMEVYLLFPEACKVAAANGSKIAQHIESQLQQPQESRELPKGIFR